MDRGQESSSAIAVRRVSTLTERELQVLQRMVAGQRLTDIARDMHLSIKTISTHKSRVMEKLQLDSNAALIRYGMQHRLHGEEAPTHWPDEPRDSITSTTPGPLD